MTVVLVVIQQKPLMIFLLETDLTDNVDDDPPAENNAIEDTTEYKLKGGMKLVKRKRAKIIRSVRFNKEKEPENYYREQLMLYTPWRTEQRLDKRLPDIPREISTSRIDC